MFRILVGCLLSLLVLFAFGGVTTVVRSALAADAAESRCQSDRAEIMKQSDYQRRIEEQRKARAEERQIAAVGAVETEEGSYDYLVLIVLVTSAGVLAFLATRKRRTRASW